MKILISFLLLAFFINTYAQDTVYLDQKYKTINQKMQAHFYRVVDKDPDNSKLVVERTYFKNGNIKRETKYSNYHSKKKKLEKHTVWYDNGQVHIESNYKKGTKEGFFISYWENGQLKRKDLYKKGVFKEGTCWNSSGGKVPYYDFEVQPTFPGGKEALIAYLKKNIQYNNLPASSKGQRVIIRFTIDTDGSVVDVKVRKSLDPISDREAKRVIQNMPRWKPAIQDGNRVKVSRSLPLTF